jgi:alcohol dehydrogenase (cytochrome c)
MIRHLLVQANRNGFLYVLDRTSGKFLKATPFVQKLNWATTVDPSGQPLLSGRIPTAQGTYICPGINGATIALESCNVYFTNPKPFTPGETYYATGTKLRRDEFAQKTLLAYSVPDGKVVWRYPQIGQADSWGGTLTTAGGLVFFGDDAGSLEAVDARTGGPLWHFNTGQTMYASPMTYMIDEVQYVAVAAGSNVFSFTLPH